MEKIETDIEGVFLIRPRVHTDERGFFVETFRAEEFSALGLPTEFAQDNHSGSSKGVLRGLHYQVDVPQGKLVRVTTGKVFDVAVDIRRNSATFGHWTGAVLSAENRLMFWIPGGFAHGFFVLSEYAETMYKCTTPYVAENDRCLRWDDPDLAIEWPIEIGQLPILSDKDASAPRLSDAELP